MHKRLLTAATLAVMPVVAHAQGDDVAAFYKGKQVSIIVGYGPGGGYDAYTRALVGHMGRHIPGNPALVIQYMPGAGSLVAANHIARVAPKDGTVLGVFSVTTALAPMFGNAQAQFETNKLGWIGNMFADAGACGTWRTSGLSGIRELIGARSEVSFGATGPDSAGNQQALVLKSVLGANLKVITGYKGIKEVGLALEKGEIAAACALSVAVVKSSFSAEYAKGDLRLLVQLGRDKDPYFKDTPHIYDMPMSPEQKGIADLVFGQSDISRPLIGPPEMPPQVLAALRKAFMATLADPQFLAGAARMNVDVTPMSGQETARRVAEFTRTPPEVVAKAKAIMGP